MKSKVWRKGRWYWYCATEDNSLGWRDHWSCAAVSRLTYSSEEEALKAGQRHSRSKDHEIFATQVQ